MRTRGRRAGDAAALEAVVAAAAHSQELLFDAAVPAAPRPRAPTPPAPPPPPRPPGPAPALVPAPRTDAASAPASRHLWLALQLTDLPLAAVASPGEREGAPFAVVDGTHARRPVVACNAAAAAAGVRPGLALNAAHALAPGLDVRDRAPVLEERRLQALARWGTGYTPFVSLEPPDTLLLEVRGSLRLFGGARALVERAVRELEAHGHAVACALAPTPRAALWLARGAPGALVDSPARLAGALSALSAAAAGWDERTYEQLARLGVRTLGELRRLPRDGLARRLEPVRLAELDEAFGLRPAPRRRHVLPERFRERVELTCELESLEHMAPAIERLLDRMGRFLRVRDAGVARLALTFVHRRAAPTVVTLGRGAPCGEPAEWRLLARERLGRVELPEPVLAIVLRTSVTLPLAGATASLPGLAAEESRANAGALLDRLRARLGDAAVSGVCLVPEHRPERAWRRVTPAAHGGEGVAGRAKDAAAKRTAATPTAATLRPPKPVGSTSGIAAAGAARPDLRRSRRTKAADRSSPGHAVVPAAPRPLWLLATPERLRVQQGQPCHDGFLRFEAGPERIESGWWDGHDVVRDYYVARTRTGVRLWIYREPGAAPRWFLHGVFG
jgi:protein ImuB